ncbi:MAG: HEAT repeat domain-containing protein, partial [Planctomycetota bacterium]
VCGRCHSESFMVQPGYEPGGDLWSFMDPNGLEDRKHVHPDGRARELIHNMLPIMQSPCGPFACSDCHDPHGSSHSGDLRHPLTDDTVCTKCHTDIAGALTAHTHHKASSAGSRCVHCHMPRLVIEAGHGWTYDHTISIPSVENSEIAGLPNACASCHLLEDFKWEYESFRRWYPDAEKHNHRVALAAAFAGGREKKPEAKPLLERYAKNANPVYRAGAVRLLAGYDVDLAAALEDPSPLVRRAAIDGVNRSEPARLVPLLDDENHVLRYRAALALAERAARKDPKLRRKVIAVLHAFATQRPDVDATHYALAVLYDAAADSAQAVASYERYLRINPWDKPARRRMELLRGRQ